MRLPRFMKDSMVKRAWQVIMEVRGPVSTLLLHRRAWLGYKEVQAAVTSEVAALLRPGHISYMPGLPTVNQEVLAHIVRQVSVAYVATVGK
jgi:hypothetical protein